MPFTQSRSELNEVITPLYPHPLIPARAMYAIKSWATSSRRRQPALSLIEADLLSQR